MLIQKFCFILIYKKYYPFSVQMPMTMNDEYLGFPTENRIQSNDFRESNRLIRRDFQVRIIYNYIFLKVLKSSQCLLLPNQRDFVFFFTYLIFLSILYMYSGLNVIC